MAKPIGFGGRDYPDFGISDAFHSQSYSIDIAELAVRLGSPIVFDRTGVVLLLETFDYGVGAWNLADASGNTKPSVTANLSYASPYCLRFHVDRDNSLSTNASLKAAFPYLSIMGIQFAFLTRRDFQLLDVEFSMFGVTEYRKALLRISQTPDLIQISSDGSTWQTLSTYGFNRGSDAGWHHVKMVADFENNHYNRLMYDGTSHSLINYDLFDEPNITSPYLYIKFSYTGLSDIDTDFYIDNVIITTHEPR